MNPRTKIDLALFEEAAAIAKKIGLEYVHEIELRAPDSTHDSFHGKSKMEDLQSHVTIHLRYNDRSGASRAAAVLGDAYTLWANDSQHCKDCDCKHKASATWRIGERIKVSSHDFTLATRAAIEERNKKYAPPEPVEDGEPIS